MARLDSTHRIASGLFHLGSNRHSYPASIHSIERLPFPSFSSSFPFYPLYPGSRMAIVYRRYIVYTMTGDVYILYYEYNESLLICPGLERCPSRTQEGRIYIISFPINEARPHHQATVTIAETHPAIIIAPPTGVKGPNTFPTFSLANTKPKIVPLKVNAPPTIIPVPTLILCELDNRGCNEMAMRARPL